MNPTGNSMKKHNVTRLVKPRDTNAIATFKSEVNVSTVFEKDRGKYDRKQKNKEKHSRNDRYDY